MTQRVRSTFSVSGKEPRRTPEVCKGLLEDRVSRGLSTGRKYLWVIGGSKALRKAIERVFGSEVAVQRCQLHKRRNVKEHLPKKHREAIDRRIRAAYKMATYEDARRSLELTIGHLERLNHLCSQEP